MLNIFSYVPRFLVEPGISVLLVVTLSLGRMLITELSLSIIIYCVAVVPLLVVTGLVGIPVSLRIKILLIWGIIVL